MKSDFKITDRLWQQQLVASLHRNYEKRRKSQKKTDVWPQRTYVQLLISAQGVNHQ